MYINYKDQYKIDRLRKFIQSLPLEDYTFCHCRAGLKDARLNLSGDYNWTGEFCDSCNGVGYKLINVSDKSIVICSNCKGLGCNDCNDIGVMDWVYAARNGITNWTE